MERVNIQIVIVAKDSIEHMILRRECANQSAMKVIHVHRDQLASLLIATVCLELSKFMTGLALNITLMGRPVFLAIQHTLAIV